MHFVHPQAWQTHTFCRHPTQVHYKMFTLTPPPKFSQGYSNYIWFFGFIVACWLQKFQTSCVISFTFVYITMFNLQNGSFHGMNKRLIPIDGPLAAASKRKRQAVRCVSNSGFGGQMKSAHCMSLILVLVKWKLFAHWWDLDSCDMPWLYGIQEDSSSLLLEI